MLALWKKWHLIFEGCIGFQLADMLGQVFQVSGCHTRGTGRMGKGEVLHNLSSLGNYKGRSQAEGFLLEFQVSQSRPSPNSSLLSVTVCLKPLGSILSHSLACTKVRIEITSSP